MARVVRRIVDASPLILLGKIGALPLLRVGGTDVIVPIAVVGEVNRRGPDQLEVRELACASWIRVVQPIPVPPAIQAWDLGEGESAVLATALQEGECEAILDDREAKRCAQTLGIAARGTLGMVLLAKRLGEITAARPLVGQLRSHGLYLAAAIVERALALVGE